MIGVNGRIVPNSKNIVDHNNRGLKFGDALFETLRSVNGHILFLEDHYFRLMAAMRIMRMHIPADFTIPYMERQLQKVLEANNLLKSIARLRLTVFRNGGGLYIPKVNDVSFIITCDFIPQDACYEIVKRDYTVDIFKDFFISPTLMSTIKTNNRALNVVAGIFSRENEFNNVLLVNTDKNIVEAVSNNVFALYGKTIKTPPLTDGCIGGIIRKQIIKYLKCKETEYHIEETSILPFELQKADSLFLTNVISGIIPITRFRKKTYDTQVAHKILDMINRDVKSHIT